MPYIKQDARHTFESHIQNLAADAENAGDLNYIITKMLHLYIKKKGLRYANCNEVIGALECCKLELYRKLIGTYEDEKIIENGGVGVFPQYDENIPQGVPASFCKEQAAKREQEANNMNGIPKAY
jgi:hypothetical protein